MAKKRIIERVRQGFNLDAEPLPGLPLVELIGDHRVLIENHCGISAYGCSDICIKVKYGYIHVCGERLNLALMSKERLIICGKIASIQLIGKR